MPRVGAKHVSFTRWKSCSVCLVLCIVVGGWKVDGRFLVADREPTWEGTFEAINENVRCLQGTLQFDYIFGQQNCLTLNIYTPIDAVSSSNLSVMVFIHGGGFFEGSGSKLFYGPQYLVSKGVILVTINYRLDILGFACLGIKEAPGNAGMKDQVAALRWIQRNIRGFGGNAESVTIFGESAGGASVGYHILSPMSKGLFHKAILQSGSSLNPWAFQYTPLNTASSLAKLFGFNTRDAKEIYAVLEQKTSAELVGVRIPRMEGNVLLSQLVHVPCIEKSINGSEPFLTDLPHDILKKGTYNKVPIIIGSNNEEGYFVTALETDDTISNIEVGKSLPRDLLLPTQDLRDEVIAKLQKIYMGDEEISTKSLLKLSRFNGEVFFTYGILEYIDYLLHTNEKPVYSYLFKHNGRRNFIKAYSGEPFWSAPGASHGDELFYLFSQQILPLFFERRMVDKMTTLWTNFAKYGDPTPEVSELLPFKWLPTNTTTPQSLVIDGEFSSAPLWYSDSLKYLKQIYTKYRRKNV